MTTDDKLAELARLAADAQQRAAAAVAGPGLHGWQDERALVTDTVPALVSGLRQTTTALHAVLDLHVAVPSYGYRTGRCAVCSTMDAYPCPTVAAVVSALDGGEHR